MASSRNSQPWYDMASICFKLGVNGDISGKLDVIKMIKARDLLNEMIKKYYIDNPQIRGGKGKKHGGNGEIPYLENPATKTQIVSSGNNVIDSSHNPLNVSTSQFNNVPGAPFTSGASIQSGVSNLGEDLANTVLPPFTSQSGAGAKKVKVNKNKNKK